MNDVEWQKVWGPRGKDYHSANSRYPSARDAERDLLLDRLDLRAGQTLLDVAAGGGYLLEKVHQRFGPDLRLLAIEPSDAFAANLPAYVNRLAHGSITRFPLANGSVDRVSNLSGLHHSTDRQSFFNESFRVLKPGGILCAADVRQDSNVARWLNEFVDTHNPHGHDGWFFVEGEMSAGLTTAGFVEVAEETAHYTWNFDSVETMIWFCQTLFGIAADEETTLNGISEILGYQDLGSGRVTMNWELIRAMGRKAR